MPVDICSAESEAETPSFALTYAPENSTTPLPAWETIEAAENRRVFEDLLDHLGSPQPPAAAVVSVEEALGTAKAIGYPVLVRPSYVLGGWAMEIVHNASDLIRYVKSASSISPHHP